jgi:methylated-DNA-[protein]-cysteine S-methyltransferase
MNTETNADHVLHDLIASSTPTQGDIEELRRRLATTAEAVGILDVAYTTMDTPIGTLLLAASEKGLLRVAFETEEFDDVLDLLGRKVSRRILRAPRRLDAAMSEIDDYFQRRRTSFDLALDFSLSSGFRLLVQRHLSEIPYGSTESYKEVAAIVGNAKAVRAVGTACATNPLPIVVPCHRVLRTNGQLGGYAGGLATKIALLELERVT